MNFSNFDTTISVIVPVRNEAGTINDVVSMLPRIGKSIEIVFVESYSTDNSWHEIKRVIEQKGKNLDIKGFRFKGARGKSPAVWFGIKHSKGKMIIILDADLSVSPGEIKKFYQKLKSQKYMFANGTRFLLPKEKGAMRYFNHLGNRLFASIFSIILKQKITDTLCGTKAFYRKDFEVMQKRFPDIFKEDPYGDFALLLGASKLNLKVAEVSVNYKARIYGKSNIDPFLDGIKLFVLLGKDFVRSFFLKDK